MKRRKDETEDIVYNVNFPAMKTRLKDYMKQKRLTNTEKEEMLNKCLNLIHVWNNNSGIRSREDEEAAFDKCKEAINSIIHERSSYESKQTICWKCKHAVPAIHNGRYVKGCEWSIYRACVPGWEADELPYGPGKKTYNVRSCPKFKKG